MITSYVFQETAPSSATTAASSQQVQGGVWSGIPNGVAFGMISDADAIDIIAELTGNTGGTLDVYLQTDDGTNTWYDAIHFKQLSAGQSVQIYRALLSHHPQSTVDAPTQIGKGLTPLLANNTMVNTIGFDRLRLLMVSGTGTTVGGSVLVRCTVQQGYERNRS